MTGPTGLPVIDTMIDFPQEGSVFPSGTFPQVSVDDPKMYPVYANARILELQG
jgi:hypothetical protein